MNLWLIVSGIACGAVWAIHTFAGGRAIAIPLRRANDLEAVPKWTQFYCWHLVTITLAVMTIGLTFSAFDPAARDLAFALGALATLFGAFGLVLPPFVGRSHAELPQGLLLLPVGVLALVGVVLGHA